MNRIPAPSPLHDGFFPNRDFFSTLLVLISIRLAVSLRGTPGATKQCRTAPCRLRCCSAGASLDRACRFGGSRSARSAGSDKSG
jgi:hypothetical protein